MVGVDKSVVLDREGGGFDDLHRGKRWESKLSIRVVKKVVEGMIDGRV